MVAPRGSLENLSDGCGHGLWVVGGYIERVGATCLFKTGTCAGNDGESAADGLDDGYAEALVARGVDERLCSGVVGRQLGVADAVEDMDALLESVVVCVACDDIGIGCVAPDDHDVEVVGEQGCLKGLDGEEDVLALLDGADG